MAATWVVEGLDIVEDSHSGLGVRTERVAVKEFGFEGRKEALTQHCHSSHRPIPWKGGHLPWCSVFRRQEKCTVILKISVHQIGRWTGIFVTDRSACLLAAYMNALFGQISVDPGGLSTPFQFVPFSAV